MTPNPVDQFLSALAVRLVAGARSYGDASFGRELSATVHEIDQELIDTPGWMFVLWAQLCMRGGVMADTTRLGGAWLDNLGRRLRSGDRELWPVGHANLGRCRSRIEVLALEAFEWREHVRAELAEILAEIEPEEQANRDLKYRARRGSTRDRRSDD